MTYTVKKEAVEKVIKEHNDGASEAERTGLEHDTEQTEAERRRAVRHIIGILLIAIAVVFGRFLGNMPAFAAFVTVFCYLMLQTYIWFS